MPAWLAMTPSRTNSGTASSGQLSTPLMAVRRPSSREEPVATRYTTDGPRIAKATGTRRTRSTTTVTPSRIMAMSEDSFRELSVELAVDLVLDAAAEHREPGGSERCEDQPGDGPGIHEDQGHTGRWRGAQERCGEQPPASPHQAPAGECDEDVGEAGHDAFASGRQPLFDDVHPQVAVGPQEVGGQDEREPHHRVLGDLACPHPAAAAGAPLDDLDRDQHQDQAEAHRTHGLLDQVKPAHETARHTSCAGSIHGRSHAWLLRAVCRGET